MHETEPWIIWIVAAVIAIATPLLGYFSPFGRIRRGMVADLQKEIEGLERKIQILEDQIDRLSKNLAECQRNSDRLIRENFHLYRQLDNLRSGRGEK